MNSSTNRLTQFLDSYYRPLSALVVVVMIVIGWFTLLWPQYQALNDSGVLQYQSALVTLREHQQYLEDLRTMSERYATIDQRVFYAVDTLIPAHRSQELLFADLEKVFANTAFTIDNMNVAKLDATAAVTSTLPEDVRLVTVSVNVSTEDPSYSSFKELLIRIQQSAQLLNLQSLNYAPGNSSYSFVFSSYERIWNPVTTLLM